VRESRRKPRETDAKESIAPPPETDVNYIAHKVKRLKNLVLIGIAKSPAQYTPIDG